MKRSHSPAGTATPDKYILEFSNESDSAVSEILKATEEVHPEFMVISRSGNVAIVESVYSCIEEMAFLNFGTRILAEFSTLEDLRDPELPQGAFHVRKKDYSGTDRTTEAEIGRKIRGDRKITFDSPDFTIRAVRTDRWYLGVLEFQKDSKGMNKRRAPLRPFFSPVTIHPKFARFLVNLSRTKSGDTILDPFCGTGGILLEAGIMGRKVIGSDASLSMVKGARLNLKYYAVQGEIMHCDFSDLDDHLLVDSIVTDLPYGKNSELSNYDLEGMYSSLFPKFHNILRKGGYIAIVLSDPELLKFAEGYFDIVSSTPFRQHRSLTRYFVCMRKLNAEQL